jgi:hypothetical protein
MSLKVVGERDQFGREVVMADGTPGLLPDLFLGVQIGCSDRVVENFQARMSGQDPLDGVALMPGGSIPKQENPHIRQRRQDVFEMLGTGFSREDRSPGDQFLTGVQIQRAIEAHFGSARVHADHGRLPDGRPYVHCCGLQVHPGFILSQDNGFGCVLSDVDQFFSTWASNSATWRSRRDL